MHRLFNLRGREAVVTGGNGGIGLGMARGPANAGARVDAHGDCIGAERLQRPNRRIRILCVACRDDVARRRAPGQALTVVKHRVVTRRRQGSDGCSLSHTDQYGGLTTTNCEPWG